MEFNDYQHFTHGMRWTHAIGKIYLEVCHADAGSIRLQYEIIFMSSYSHFSHWCKIHESTNNELTTNQLTNPQITNQLTHMLRKDKIINGLIFGLIFPLLGFIFFYQIFKVLDLLGAADSTGFASNFRERTLAIVAIALNIIPMRIFAARRVNNSIRGLVIATFILATIWFVRYGMKML